MYSVTSNSVIANVRLYALFACGVHIAAVAVTSEWTVDSETILQENFDSPGRLNETILQENFDSLGRLNETILQKNFDSPGRLSERELCELCTCQPLLTFHLTGITKIKCDVVNVTSHVQFLSDRTKLRDVTEL